MSEKGFFINAPEKVTSKHPEIEVVKDYNDLEAKLLENSTTRISTLSASLV